MHSLNIATVCYVIFGQRHTFWNLSEKTNPCN